MGNWIDVKIPWEPGKRLGYAFNRAIETVEDWVLILDYDVMLLSVNWYDICLRAIDKYGHSAGLISCMTNNIGCPLQRDNHNKTQDMDWHFSRAAEVERKNAGVVQDVTDSQFKLSGMFFLTHRSAWEKTGRVPDDKFIGVDNWYDARIRENGYKVLILRDLYVYHGYKRLWKEGAK